MLGIDDEKTQTHLERKAPSTRGQREKLHTAKGHTGKGNAMETVGTRGGGGGAGGRGASGDGLGGRTAKLRVMLSGGLMTSYICPNPRDGHPVTLMQTVTLGDSGGSAWVSSGKCVTLLGILMGRLRVCGNQESKGGLCVFPSTLL